MERNRWETAIRCLEIALHPNTSDDEVIAGVNGFRRTAAGTPLRDICAAFAPPPGNPVSERETARWQSKAERAALDNLALRRRLAEEQVGRETAERRLREAEEELAALRDTVAAAQGRAAALERSYAEIRMPEIELPAPPRPRPAPPPARPASSSFPEILAAARQRAESWTA